MMNVADEVRRLNEMYDNISLSCHNPKSFIGPEKMDCSDDRQVPKIYIETFKRKGTKWANIDESLVTVGDLYTIQEKSVTGAMWKDLEFLKERYWSGKFWNVCIDALEVRSLTEYAIAGWKFLHQLHPCRAKSFDSNIYVVATRMGLGNISAERTLDEVGQELGMVRERVRQIEENIGKSLFDSSYRRDLFEDFCIVVDETMCGRNGVISVAEFIRIVEARFNWSGTTGWSLLCFLRWVGYDVEGIYDQFESNMTLRFRVGGDGDKESLFLKIIRDAHCSEDMKYEPVCEKFREHGYSLSRDEYNAFADTTLNNRDISLRVRGFLKAVRGGSASNVVNARNIITMVFKEAYENGCMYLVKDELLKKCEEKNNQIDWGNMFRGIMNDKGRLDDNESFVLQYDYIESGSRGRKLTGYALSEIVVTDEVRGKMREMVDNLKNVLQTSGYRVIGIHKAWKKVFKDGDVLPRMAAFFLPRGIREFADMLYFHDTKDMRFCVSLPSEQDCGENLLRVETIKYFKDLGRSSVMRNEVVKFLEENLQYEWNSMDIPWLEKNGRGLYNIS